MPILRNIGVLATCRESGGQSEIHPVENAALVWEKELILWLGRERDLPKKYGELQSIDGNGRLVIPGLIDCHTHLCFGGWRGDEFELRIRGTSYLEIAKAGGGIASTVAKTRAASLEELVERGLLFLGEMAKLGVTTVECKSGYGLTLSDEQKLLRAYREVSERQPLEIVPTFLGAHIVPPEFREKRRAYLDLVIDEMIPKIARESLAEFCDIFVEESAFTAEEAREILTAGKKHGLVPKLHADQLSDGRGAALAAEIGAVSADHLEHISAEGISRLKERGVVAVALPIASLYTHQPPLDARRLVNAGVPVSIASDFNPGSAPSYHLPLAMMLACTMNRLTPAEALKGATIFAAKAIRRERTLGSLEIGKQADFAIIDAPNVNHWMYHFRANACTGVVKRGEFLIPFS